MLRGAQSIIARSPHCHIILEWSQRQMAQAGIAPQDVLALLEGFTPYRIVLGSNEFDHPVSFDWLLAEDYTDVLFVRR